MTGALNTTTTLFDGQASIAAENLDPTLGDAGGNIGCITSDDWTDMAER